MVAHVVTNLAESRITYVTNFVTFLELFLVILFFFLRFLFV